MFLTVSPEAAVAFRATLMSLEFQPAAFGCGETDAVVTGAVFAAFCGTAFCVVGTGVWVGALVAVAGGLGVAVNVDVLVGAAVLVGCGVNVGVGVGVLVAV